jgi:Predicted ester cyclase
MDPIAIAQRYFDGWNRRDPAAVLDTMAPDGTYSDPGTGGPINGDAFIGYMTGLFSAFPDVSFEIASVGLSAPDLVAAQWVMRGTNTGSMYGLPPTSKSIELRGADFIRVAGDRIRSVDGYFDSGEVPRQLGLQVIVQPTSIGPFQFGISTRVSKGSATRPGAFSITAITPRNAEDQNLIREMSRQVATEMLAMKGFIGWVGVTVANRMLTITAWENASDPQQLMERGKHPEAMNKFFAGELGEKAYTSVFAADHINASWVRCTSCATMVDHAARQGTCACGATLPQPMAYW